MTTSVTRDGYYASTLLLSLLLLALTVSSCSAFVTFSPPRRPIASSLRFFENAPFASSRRRQRTSLPFSQQDPGNDDDDESASAPPSSFESVVRNVTGKKDYKFGDLTRGATHVVEDLAKKTNLVDEDYHFGDITKGAIESIQKPVESALSGAERALTLIASGDEANVHELVALSNIVWSENLSSDQRRETWIIMIHLAAIAVLAYNFLANLQSGMVTAFAWTRTSIVTGTSPLQSNNHWARFLQIQGTLNMVFGGPFLPARAIIAVKFFFPYRRLVVKVQRLSPLKDKYPLVNRVCSIFGMWVIVNLGFVSLLTTAMIWLGSVWTGVPMIPTR